MNISQTRYVVETEQIRIVRRRNRSTRAYCDKCHAEVRMLPPEEAAILVSDVAGRIYGLMEAALVHFRVGEDQKVLVCLSSLSQF